MLLILSLWYMPYFLDQNTRVILFLRVLLLHVLSDGNSYQLTKLVASCDLSSVRSINHKRLRDSSDDLAYWSITIQNFFPHIPNYTSKISYISFNALIAQLPPSNDTFDFHYIRLPIRLGARFCKFMLPD